MAEKTPQEILDDLHAAQIEAQKAGLIDQREKTDAVIGEAQSAKAKENTGADADYNNYQKTNAGKSETSGMYAYNAYRSRLSAAAKAAQNAKDKADLSYNMTKANANANLSNAQAAEQAARSDQHWQQEQWEYQLAADEAAKQAASRGRASSYGSTPDSIEFEEFTQGRAQADTSAGRGRDGSFMRKEAKDKIVIDETKKAIDDVMTDYRSGTYDLDRLYKKIFTTIIPEAKRKGLSKEQIKAIEQYVRTFFTKSR